MSFILPSFSFLILTKNVSAFLKTEFFPRYYLLSYNMTWRGNKELTKHSCPIDQNTIPLNPRKVMRGGKGSHINSKISMRDWPSLYGGKQSAEGKDCFGAYWEHVKERQVRNTHRTQWRYLSFAICNIPRTGLNKE